MSAPADTETWRACLAAEGPALGLEGCRAFLENKYINDAFFEGT